MVLDATSNEEMNLGHRGQRGRRQGVGSARLSNLEHWSSRYLFSGHVRQHEHRGAVVPGRLPQLYTIILPPVEVFLSPQGNELRPLRLHVYRSKSRINACFQDGMVRGINNCVALEKRILVLNEWDGNGRTSR